MDIPTIPGAVYSIASSSSCDVTDKASGKPLGTATPGSPVTTPAYSDALTLSDPDALYVQIKTFNFALAALGLLGGGEAAAPDALPAGYLAAEFLESTGLNFIIDTKIYPDTETGWLADGVFTKRTENWAVSAYAPPNRYYFCCGFWNDTGTICVGQNTNNNQPSRLQYSGYSRFQARVNFKNSRITEFERGGAVTIAPIGTAVSKMTDSLYVFGRSNNNCDYRLFKLQFSQGEEIIKDYCMCLDHAGVPCMFDLVSKQPFYNSGTGLFIVGMNMKQALKLSTLPATGGSLTISLPEGYDADTAVTAAIATATANGWNFTIQTYTPETAAASSSFALRRIWVRQTPDEFGSYVDASGNRFTVEWCVAMSNTDGSEPDAHRYELFRSVDAAVDFWQLTPYVDPEAESLTDTP